MIIKVFRLERKRRILYRSVLLACIFLMLLGSVQVYASDFDVTQVQLFIKINEDGSANVEERWFVDYGFYTHSRFYKDVYKNLPMDESFSALEDLEVFIDGNPCSLTDSPDLRPDYTFYLDENRERYQISAFKETNIRTRYYFSYKLTDVVKNVDNKYNLFVFMPIGAKFEPLVRKVEVHFEGPSGSTPRVLYSTKGKPVISGSDVDITSGFNKGIYKIRVRMDGADIPGAVPISSKRVSHADSRFKEFLFSKCIPAFSFLYLFILGIQVKVRKWWKTYNNNKMSRLFQEDPKIYSNNLQIIKDNMEPTELSQLLSKFYLYEFARMVQLDKIRLDNGNFWLDRYPKELDKGEADLYDFILGFLKIHSDAEHTDGWYYVDYSLFGHFLEDQYEFVISHSMSLESGLKANLGKDKDDRRRILSALKMIKEYSSLIYTREYLYDIILNEKDPYLLAVRIHCMGDMDRPVHLIDANNYNHWYMDYLNIYYSVAERNYTMAHAPKQSSGYYSSGSSGSSCSSCGGGGAD